MLAMAKTTGRQMTYDRDMRMDGNPEMRRQRDSRGRYMMEDEYDQPSAWVPPHMPPYLDRPGMTDKHFSPYGDQPEVYRKQEQDRSPDMRRMTYGKTSGGNISYNRPDGATGNVSYYMHKTDPLNQREQEPMEQPRQIGFQQDEDNGQLDKQTVMRWVDEMEDAEGVKGGKYTWHQAQQYAMNKGITGQQRQLEFYWAMNAMYADYHEAGKKFGVDKPEFYACLAKLFIEDPDAVEDKVEKYVKHIAKHQ
jgi:hypothetical protein